MQDADTIETINREQLATATDRLLLRGGRVSKRRPTRPYAPAARGSYQVVPPAPLARGSQPWVAFDTVHPAYERTVPARRRTPVYAQMFALLVAVPALVGVAIGIAALL
jgi:hypothetical protein